MNETFGWLLILVGFLSGAALGLFFHREDFFGGYGAFRRRVLRLGHIACVALGMLNVLFATAVRGETTARSAHAWAAWLFLVGGILMPLVCFLTSWRAPFRHFFALPVASLVAAVALVVWQKFLGVAS